MSTLLARPLDCKYENKDNCCNRILVKNFKKNSFSNISKDTGFLVKIELEAKIPLNLLIAEVLLIYQ
jgi:hypothetical protein